MEIKSDILNGTNGDADLRFIRVKKSELDHGNEIEEIISHKPPFFVRWGTVFFFVLLLIIAFVAWLIQYPDIVTANGVLNSINAPKEVIARTEGKLVKLFSTENEHVKKGDVLGFIESTADHAEVLRLSDNVDSIINLIQDNKTDELANNNFVSFNHLGELQNTFQVYMQALQQFSNYLSNGFLPAKEKDAE